MKIKLVVASAVAIGVAISAASLLSDNETVGVAASAPEGADRDREQVKPDEVETNEIFAEPIDKPATFEEFLTHDGLDVVVTGQVLRTEVEPIESPADSPKTVVSFHVEKSSDVTNVKPGSKIKVRFDGARTTMGWVHKIHSVKLKPNGDLESAPVSPDDKTPVHFKVNGALPPETGDHMLLFLVPLDEKWGDRDVMSINRGAYFASSGGNSRSGSADTFSRKTNAEDSNLSQVRVGQLNQIISRLKNQRSDQGFKHNTL